MASLDARCDACVIFTDGLQQLALRYATQDAESRFLEPMVDALRQSEAPEKLESGLSEFLHSERVNARTDDDKTLLIAARVDEG